MYVSVPIASLGMFYNFEARRSAIFFLRCVLLRRLFKYCALPPPCIDRSGASRRGGLSNTISGEGVRVVGVGSIVSGLAEPPRTLSPFLRNLHLTIQRTIETPRESLPQELSTSRASDRVCSWVGVGAAPPGPFPARARLEVDCTR